jgi:hypothetical protein
MPGAESVCNGGQFTYFLTAPMQAFCQLAGITSDIDVVRSFMLELSTPDIFISVVLFFRLGFRIHMPMLKTYFCLLWSNMKKPSVRLLG